MYYFLDFISTFLTIGKFLFALDNCKNTVLLSHNFSDNLLSWSNILTSKDDNVIGDPVCTYGIPAELSALV